MWKDVERGGRRRAALRCGRVHACSCLNCLKWLPLSCTPDPSPPHSLAPPLSFPPGPRGDRHRGEPGALLCGRRGRGGLVGRPAAGAGQAVGPCSLRRPGRPKSASFLLPVFFHPCSMCSCSLRVCPALQHRLEAYSLDSAAASHATKLFELENLELHRKLGAQARGGKVDSLLGFHTQHSTSGSSSEPAAASSATHSWPQLARRQAGGLHRLS